MSAVAELEVPLPVTPAFVMPSGDQGDPIWVYPNGESGQRQAGFILKRGDKSVSISYINARGSEKLGFLDNVVHVSDPRTKMPNRRDSTWEKRESSWERDLRLHLTQMQEAINICVAAARVKPEGKAK